jgi:hypothetical protein
LPGHTRVYSPAALPFRLVEGRIDQALLLRLRLVVTEQPTHRPIEVPRRPRPEVGVACHYTSLPMGGSRGRLSHDLRWWPMGNWHTVGLVSGSDPWLDFELTAPIDLGNGVELTQVQGMPKAADTCPQPPDDLSRTVPAHSRAPTALTESTKAPEPLWVPGPSAWLRGLDLNQRPLGYEPNELPDCSTPRCRLIRYWTGHTVSSCPARNRDAPRRNRSGPKPAGGTDRYINIATVKELGL